MADITLTETLEKRQLVVTLAGIDGAPSEFFFMGVQYLRNAKGEDVVPPRHGVRMEATAEDVAKYLGEKAPAQAAAVQEQGALASQLKEQLDAANAATAEANAQVVAIQNRLVAATTALQSLRGNAEAALKAFE